MLTRAQRLLFGLVALAAPASAFADTSPAPTSPSTQPSTPTVAEEDPVESAVAFAKALTDNATAALTREDAGEAERLIAFQDVLKEGLALDYIGRIMIGEARKTMSDEQTARYQSVFPDYITRQYAEQFSDIVGRPLEVVEARQVKKDVIVRTRFDRVEGSPVTVDWRVRRTRGGEQKITDIIVSGVSIMLVKREEFAAFIAANDVDSLLARLEADAIARGA